MLQVLSEWCLAPALVIAGYFLLRYILHSWRSFRRNDDKTKLVLITGCDSGFGCYSALDFSESGCKVLAACLTQAGVDQLKENPKFNGVAFQMDVTKRKDIEKAVEIVSKEDNGEGLYALVNNAGILRPAPLDWQTEEDLRYIMEVNCWGTVLVTKALLPFLKKREGSSKIVNVSSMAGRVLLGYGTSYCMSKYAIEAFSDGLRYELKPFNISVHLIEPGMFKTSILSPKLCTNFIRDSWKKTKKETKEEYGQEYVDELCLRYEDLIEKIASTKFQKVVSAIKQAVMSYEGKPRYVVGFDGNTIWLAVATLPTAIGDWILSSVSPPLVPIITKQRNNKNKSD